jgi:hypothetical protein
MRLAPRRLVLGLGLGLAVAVLITWTRIGGSPVDAFCYYSMDPASPYRPDRCFLYTPPVAQVMTVIQSVVPFDAFVITLRTLEMISLVLLTGPAIGGALLIPAVEIELNAANINILLIGAVLLGFRYPWTWAFVILTKLTPGVGLLWFAVRREWRSLAIAVATTGAIAAVSFILAPGLWGAYLSALVAAPDESSFPIWLRLPFAAAIVIWGARSNHRWAMVVAVFLALPRWYFLSPVVLVGLFRVVTFPRPLPFPAIGLRPFRPKPGQPAAATTGSSVGRTNRAPSS